MAHTHTYWELFYHQIAFVFFCKQGKQKLAPTLFLLFCRRETTSRGRARELMSRLATAGCIHTILQYSMSFLRASVIFSLLFPRVVVVAFVLVASRAGLYEHPNAAL